MDIIVLISALVIGVLVIIQGVSLFSGRECDQAMRAFYTVIPLFKGDSILWEKIEKMLSKTCADMIVFVDFGIEESQRNIAEKLCTNTGVAVLIKPEELVNTVSRLSI